MIVKGKAVFLDRDQTLIRGYGSRPANTVEEVELLPSVASGLKILGSAGFTLVVVSNQGGIGLGYTTADMVRAQNEALNDLLIMEGAPAIEAFIFCPHKPSEGCECRKPKPGMILTMADMVDLGKSYMVGDAGTDIDAGRAAGVRACFKVEDDNFMLIAQSIVNIDRGLACTS